MIIEILILTLYFFCLITGYRYMRSLFSELGFSWKPNRAIWAVICIAGPAALVCALVVDATRPV